MDFYFQVHIYFCSFHRKIAHKVCYNKKEKQITDKEGVWQNE